MIKATLDQLLGDEECRRSSCTVIVHVQNRYACWWREKERERWKWVCDYSTAKLTENIKINTNIILLIQQLNCEFEIWQLPVIPTSYRQACPQVESPNTYPQVACCIVRKIVNADRYWFVVRQVLVTTICLRQTLRRQATDRPLDNAQRANY